MWCRNSRVERVGACCLPGRAKRSGIARLLSQPVKRPTRIPLTPLYALVEARMILVPQAHNHACGWRVPLAPDEPARAKNVEFDDVLKRADANDAIRLLYACCKCA